MLRVIRGHIADDLVARLYQQAEAVRWSVPRAAFADALQVSVAKAFGSADPGGREVEKYLSALHLKDLALACACAHGNDAAWEQFIRDHRPVLYRTADALDPSGGARELADALYADLYGTRERAGERQSLFRYFHGRSTLATWLRSVLAQRHVDAVRARRRTQPLEAADDRQAVRAAQTDTERQRYLDLMERALTAAVEALGARDRLRLASYYTQGLTLAQVGRLLGEHEATVSRQLARTRREIRRSVEAELRTSYGLIEPQVEQCFACALDDPGPLDLSRIIRKDSGLDRSI